MFTERNTKAVVEMPLTEKWSHPLGQQIEGLRYLIDFPSLIIYLEKYPELWPVSKGAAYKKHLESYNDKKVLTWSIGAFFTSVLCLIESKQFIYGGKSAFIKLIFLPMLATNFILNEYTNTEKNEIDKLYLEIYADIPKINYLGSVNKFMM